MARLAALDGEDFEAAFLEMMTRHHAKAVRESEHCERRAYHEERIFLCESIAGSQTAETEEMEAWLVAWFD